MRYTWKVYYQNPGDWALDVPPKLTDDPKVDFVFDTKQYSYQNAVLCARLAGYPVALEKGKERVR